MTAPPTLMGYVRDLFTHNLPLKGLSLALAICVWGLTSGSRHTTLELALPTRVLHIPAGFRPAATDAGTVRVELSGPSMLLQGVKRSNQEIVLNLSNAAAPGKTEFSHLERYLKLPEQVQVTRTTPAAITIDLIRGQIPTQQGETHR